MKILPFEIPKPTKDALIYQEDREVVFFNKLHQHKEVQFSLIVKGSGTLLVGDTITRYESNQIICLGSNLPHLFKSTDSIEESIMITLFFNPEDFKQLFFELEDAKTLQPLFSELTFGFTVDNNEVLSSLFLKLKSAQKFERIIHFLNILNNLNQESRKLLSTFQQKKLYTDNEGKRMQNVISFTLNNYQRKIELAEIASVANLTKNAFCKYFKNRTNKSYIQFVNEIRVENACQLLIKDKDISVSEVAYKSGFVNLSNFNRTFKTIKSSTPIQFRKSM